MAGISVLLCGYLLSQFFRSFLAVLTSALAVDPGLTDAQLSNASAAWFLVFALAQFPIGVWLDKYGPRRTASALLLFGGAGGVALFAVAQNAWMAIVAMGLIGLGCAPVLMASFFLFAHEFPADRFATLGALFVGLGTLGNVLGSEPLALAVEVYGWRNVAWGLFVITLLVACGIFFLVRDPKVEKPEGGSGSLLDVLKIKTLWFIFPMVLVSYSVPAGIRGLWAGPYLRDVFGLETAEIGRVTLYMAIALVIGSITFGPLDRVFNSRKWVIFGGNLFVLLALVWLYLAQAPSISQVSIAMVAIGFFGAAYAVQMAHGRSFVPKHLTGRGVTLLNFFSIGGAGLMQFLSGFTVENFSAGADDTKRFAVLFGFYAIALFVAMAIYLFSKDAKPRSG